MKVIPIYLLYLTTFGLASFEKFRAGAVPDWFIQQFSGTFLNFHPGALALQFYSIATLEASVVFLLLGSFFKREPFKAKRPILKGALFLATLVFVILGFGLRLTHDFRGAAESFSYFGVSLVSLLFVDHDSEVSNA
jgi:hypothetical protein